MRHDSDRKKMLEKSDHLESSANIFIQTWTENYKNKLKCLNLHTCPISHCFSNLNEIPKYSNFYQTQFRGKRIKQKKTYKTQPMTASDEFLSRILGKTLFIQEPNSHS